MSFETVSVCPVCNNADLDSFLSAVDHTATGERFELIRCSQCDLAITSPRPTSASISRYYQSTQYISHTRGGSSLTDRIYRAVRHYSISKKLSLIRRYQQTANLLDFGAGTGEFLLAARRAGWNCSGVEPSPEARTRIHQDIDVYESLRGLNSRFNVITLWHVLEHVHELNDTLAKLISLLEPDGTLFIAVPNRDSYDAHHYGKYWAGYDVPRHLWHFTKPSMLRLLSRHQLKVADILPMKFDAFYVSLLSNSYQRPTARLVNIASAIFNGLKSNMLAGPDNYSSLIYIARRR